MISGNIERIDKLGMFRLIASLADKSSPSGREKDVTLVRGLLGMEKISLEKLRDRVNTMLLGEKEMLHAGRNLAEVSA
jgi:hypothetical protein